MPPKGRSKGKTVSLSEFVGTTGGNDLDWAEDHWEEEADLGGSAGVSAEHQKEIYLRKLTAQRYNHESTKLGKKPGFRDQDEDDEAATGPFYAHLSNVHVSATEDDIIQHFFGLVVKNVIFEDTTRDVVNEEGKTKKQTRRFGLVEFESLKDLKFAENRDQDSLKGLKMKVIRADPERVEKMLRPRGGLRQQQGGVAHSLSGFGRDDMGEGVARQPQQSRFGSGGGGASNREDVGSFRSGPVQQQGGGNLAGWRDEQPVAQPQSPVAEGERFRNDRHRNDRPPRGERPQRQDRNAAPANTSENMDRW
eukprot:CAMPEP_0176431912 /NCGR_PEP_ID=MMETSP0127-20121128/15077_1 /TAXON_ID=938130 /ORGANISM="Platyophrya macrostoma, Strain WH" /LENGTH=306 /DNA_ID=CAMNT_0017813975 /DNA_START=142 /DNA_END=1059 /DNA_ORIENTATION=+